MQGDVLVLPAGTGHCNVGATDDLQVIGAHPDGMWCDVRRGDPAEREEVLANIVRSRSGSGRVGDRKRAP